MNDNFIKRGQFSDEECEYIRSWIAAVNQTLPENYRAALNSVMQNSDILAEMADTFRDKNEARDTMKKLVILVDNDRVYVLSSFADIVMSGKKFAIVMSTLAALGGGLAIAMKSLGVFP